MANDHNISYRPDISFSTEFLHQDLDSAHGGVASMPSPPNISHDDDGDSDSAVQTNFNFMPYPESSSTTSPSNLAVSSDVPGSCSPHLPLSDTLEHAASQHSARKPLTGRDKRRIDLAPDQPRTTQGHPRARVFLACTQWYAPPPR